MYECFIWARRLVSGTEAFLGHELSGAGRRSRWLDQLGCLVRGQRLAQMRVVSVRSRLLDKQQSLPVGASLAATSRDLS